MTKNPKCHYCGDPFATDKGVELHRKDATQVYPKSNCVLVHKKCHPPQEKADNINKNRVHTNKSNSMRKEDTQTSTHQSTTVKSTNNAGGKDYSQYLFQGIKYCKRRLVLAIVKQYLQDNPHTSYAKLSCKFPTELQGSQGVFRRIDNIINEGRYMMDDKLKTGDGITIAVWGDWGAIKNNYGTVKQDIDNFIRHVKKNIGYNLRKAR